MDNESNGLKFFSKYYIHKKNNKLDDIDKKIDIYENNINQLEKAIEQKKVLLEKLKIENTLYKKRYVELRSIFYNRGMTITVANKGYKIKEWDNLYLKKKYNLIVVCLKDGQEVKVLNEEVTFLLEDILKNKIYSIVATNVNDDTIRAQLHVDC